MITIVPAPEPPASSSTGGCVFSVDASSGSAATASPTGSSRSEVAFQGSNDVVLAGSLTGSGAGSTVAASLAGVDPDSVEVDAWSRAQGSYGHDEAVGAGSE